MKILYSFKIPFFDHLVVSAAKDNTLTEKKILIAGLYISNWSFLNLPQ